ncbi:hypothetical protein K9N68_00405 [Kovacikia minuta CCNUW1]|uniref:hypothetical protein n=1 Tax=Kovacikia minuta TaxID=2931930 RepID=UPI001CCF9602|nr:hypothetical protein [Kovacikia minuta]UBF26510.1 hypothetical protein K9N68_00405 [Kovacikia minuta CCNUW1]
MLPKLWNWLAATVVLGGAMGCSQYSQPTVESLKAVQAAATVENIQSIQKQPNVGATLYLKGKVGRQAPLLSRTAYELQDATGSIWILTKQPVPQQGDEVVIKGKLRHQKIQLNGKEQGAVYVEQQEQLQPTPAQKGGIQ